MERRSFPKFFIPTAIGGIASIGLGTAVNMASLAYPDAPHWVWLLAFWVSILGTLPFLVWLAAWSTNSFVLPLFGLRISRQSNAVSSDGPDMSVRDAFAQIDPDFIESQGGEDRWETVGQAMLDKLATGQLKAWGRRRDAPTDTQVEITDRTFWANSDWTYWFFDGPQNSPQDVKHKRTSEAYRDVQFNSSQVTSLWPRPRKRAAWPDYNKWRKADPIKLYEAACLWWELEPTLSMSQIAQLTAAEIAANYRAVRRRPITDADVILQQTDLNEYGYTSRPPPLPPETEISRAELATYAKKSGHYAKFLDPELKS